MQMVKHSYIYKEVCRTLQVRRSALIFARFGIRNLRTLLLKQMGRLHRFGQKQKAGLLPAFCFGAEGGT